MTYACVALCTSVLSPTPNSLKNKPKSQTTTPPPSSLELKMSEHISKITRNTVSSIPASNVCIFKLKVKYNKFLGFCRPINVSLSLSWSWKHKLQKWISSLFHVTQTGFACSTCYLASIKGYEENNKIDKKRLFEEEILLSCILSWNVYSCWSSFLWDFRVQCPLSVVCVSCPFQQFMMGTQTFEHGIVTSIRCI